MRKTILFLSLVCIGMILIAGCSTNNVKSPPYTPAQTPTIGKPALVKITEEGSNLVIEITNRGQYTDDYMAVVIFYDGNVKLGPLGTHFADAAPGETVRAKIPVPKDATDYKFDGVATTIAGQMVRVDYILV